MTHWLRLAPLAALLSLAAMPTVADPCPSLVGRWNVTAQSAAYDASLPPFSYVSSVGHFVVEHQSDCLFHASYLRTDVAEPLQRLVGAIGPSSEITLTGNSTLARGILVGRNRIRFVVTDFAPAGTINASLGVAIRE